MKWLLVSASFLTAACLLFFLLFLAVAGLIVPIDFVLAVALGWAFYLARVLPEVTIDGAGLATATICLVLVIAGTHGFLRWLARESRPPDGDSAARPWRFRWTASIVGLVLLMFVAGIAATGVVHQVGWLLTSGEPLTRGPASVAAQRAQSTNNLRSIGLGLDNYHRAHDRFPPGGTFDDLGRPLHGWQAMLLPFVEEQALHDRIDFERPWDDPANRAAFQMSVFGYLNPGLREEEDATGNALSHYAGNARMLGGDRPRSIVDVIDGVSNTILAGEVAADPRPWGHPANWRDPALGINRVPEGFGSPFPGGANVLFADGSVRFISETTDPEILRALSTPDGGEAVAADDY